jgi:WD40 repeat protein
MFSASSDRSLRLWDVGRGVQLGVLEGHAGEVNGCDVSPDGALVASVSSDGSMKIWNARAASCLATFHVDGSLSSCVFARNGGALVAVGDMGVYFLGLVDASPVAAEATVTD